MYVLSMNTKEQHQPPHVPHGFRRDEWLCAVMERVESRAQRAVLSAVAQKSQDNQVVLHPQDTEEIAEVSQMTQAQVLGLIHDGIAGGWISPIEHSGHRLRFKLRMPPP